MRVGIDVSCLPHPSLGTYTYFLIEALGRIDQQNEYVLFFNSLRKPVPRLPLVDHSRFKVRRLRYPRFSTSTFPGLFYVRKVLPFWASQENVDVFHSPAGLPVIGQNFASVLSIHHLNPPESMTREEQRFTEALRTLSKKVETILVVSQSTKQDVFRSLGIPENKIRVTYNGVDHNVYRKLSDEEVPSRTLQKYGLSRPFVLYVAGINRRKNLHTALRALAILRKKRNWPVRMVVVGRVYDPEYFGEIQRLLRDEGLESCVHFLGHGQIAEIAHLMNLAEVFVYPSFYEGFGRSALEAMACGCPVIASRTSALPEVVSDGGVLVDPNSAEEFGSAFELVLGDTRLRSRLATKALNRAQQFTWEYTARETLVGYRTAYENKKLPGEFVA